MSFVPAKAPPGAKTLEAKWYVSPGVFAQEQGVIFAREWICVGRGEQIPAAGDFFLTSICGESIIVTRDESDTIRAFFNVCRHRGTRLCSDESGSFGRSIQCPYHAWTYGLDGALRAARNMDKETGFDRADYPLHSVAAAVFENFIFVNIGSQPEPFEAVFGTLAERFAPWEIGTLRTAHRTVYEVDCNWKLVFLNYSECYHCPLIHPQLERLSPSDSGRNDLVEGPFLGGYSELRAPGGSLNTNGRRSRTPLGTVRGEDLQRVFYYTLFPSMLLSLHADYVMTHYVQPLAADKTRVVCEWLFSPAQMAQPDFDPMDAVHFWDLTNRQDWRVNALTQLGLGSRAYIPGPYNEQEGLLHAFDRHYLRVMDSPG